MSGKSKTAETTAKFKFLLKNSAGWTSLLTFVILALAWLVGFAARLSR